MRAHWVLLALVIMSVRGLAQTEASMCVVITDVCCNTGFTTGDYTIPEGKHITKTFLYHNGSLDNKVYVECWDIVNGRENIMFWSLDNLCGCDENGTTEGHEIGGNHNLRFKVKCKECDDNCIQGSSTVYIYTSATAASCPSPCEPQRP